MNHAEIIQLSATALAQAIRRGELSAREVTEAHIARIEAVNPQLNAVVVTFFDQARAAADAADTAYRRREPLGALHGVPMTIKDQFDIAGQPTSYGMARLQGNVAAADGRMVAAVRKAGAILLGKTNVPQTLGAIETDNQMWGRTNNPWNLDRTAGGSSGGEAAIIAAGGVPLGLGGDYGGSLRVPAACCGICAIKPTARRLPLDQPPLRTADGAEGMVAQPGPMARTVADLALALRVMVDDIVALPTGFNPPLPLRDPQAIDVTRLRVAVLPQVGDWTPSPAVRRGLHEAAAALRTCGVTVEEWTAAPDTAEGVALFYRIIGASSFAFLRQILADEAPIPLVQPTARLSSMPRAVVPLLSRIMKRSGQGRLAAMLNHSSRQSAAGLLDLLGDRLAYEARFAAALSAGNYDALLLPAMPLPAVRHGDSANLADFWGTTLLFNTLGMPAGVVPVTRVRAGEESDRPDSREKTEQLARNVEQGSTGLPVAVQVAAQHWREDIVLAIMQVLEETMRGRPDYPAHPLV